MSLTKLQVITTAGHYREKPGATHDNFSEWPETATWSGLIVKYLMDMGVEANMVAGGKLSGKANTINNLCDRYDGDSILLSVHFNSYSGDEPINGCETLYCPGSTKGEKLAKYIQPVINDVMDNKDRGVKEGWFRQDKSKGALYILRETKCPAIIIEPEFVQSHENITEKREECCMAIAQALSVFSFDKPKAKKTKKSWGKDK